MRAIFLAIALIFFVGCGYKPASVYVKQSTGDNIYAFVEIYPSDPENSVAIKDAVSEAIITKFRSKLVPVEKATTKMYFKIASVSLVPAQYDSKGYVVLYKMNVVLNAEILKDGDKAPYKVSGNGSYDFAVDPGSSLSEEKRFNAIKNSASKAIDMLISQISIKGLLENTKATR